MDHEREAAVTAEVFQYQSYMVVVMGLATVLDGTEYLPRIAIVTTRLTTILPRGEPWRHGGCVLDSDYTPLT